MGSNPAIPTKSLNDLRPRAIAAVFRLGLIHVPPLGFGAGDNTSVSRMPLMSNDADELAARLARMNKLVVDFERVRGKRGHIKNSATTATGGQRPPVDGWRRSEALLQAAIDLVGLATYAWDPKTISSSGMLA